MRIDELRDVCQGEKLKTNKGLVLLNRKVSIYVTRFFIGRSVQADSVTVAGIVAGIIGSLAFIPGDWRYNLLGALLLYISFLFDQVDGELARYYRKAGLSGVYLDEIRHLVIYSLTIFCLSFPAARDLGSRLPYLLGFAGAMALVIARVQERLPRLIFTEKIILKENCAGSDPRAASGESRAADHGGPKRASALKTVSGLIYRTAELLSGQVAIILLLAAVTIIDRFLLPAGLMNGHAAQTAFFMVFACICPPAVLGIVWGHYRGKTVEEECRRISERMRA